MSSYGLLKYYPTSNLSMHCDDIVLMLLTPRTIEVETKFTETDVSEFFRSMEKCGKETCRHTQDNTQETHHIPGSPLT